MRAQRHEPGTSFAPGCPLVFPKSFHRASATDASAADGALEMLSRVGKRVVCYFFVFVGGVAEGGNASFNLRFMREQASWRNRRGFGDDPDGREP
jgi:hypothetical protein